MRVIEAVKRLDALSVHLWELSHNQLYYGDVDHEQLVKASEEAQNIRNVLKGVKDDADGDE